MDSSYSKTTKRLDEIASLFELPISTDVTGIPSLPTLLELMSDPKTPESSTSSQRMDGLFAVYMRSNPDILYQDMQHEKDKYSPECLDLVQDIVARPRPITPKERKILDEAVLDFNRKWTPPKPVVDNKPRAVRLRETDDHSDSEDAHGDPIAGVDFPIGTDRPFWWL